MKKYKFVEVRDITFKYDLTDVNPERIYNHFMNEDDEICYIFQEDSLYGIVTIGDLFRYFGSDERAIFINQKYSSLSELDYEEAEKIFEKIPTIHEIPVVFEKQLIGVIRKGKNTEVQWNSLRKRLEEEYSGARKWYRTELNKWSKKIKGRLFVYQIPTFDVAKLSREEKKVWNKKRTYPSGGSGLLKMSEEEKRSFFGCNYSDGCVESFCRDYAKITATIQNGIYKIDDLCSNYINFKDGYRNVPNANKKAVRKVWVFGPCTAVGAYVSDSQTIEFYLQQMLLDNKYDNYEVINCGLYSYEYVMGRVITEAISDDDIVIIIYHVIPDGDLGALYKGNLGEIYFELEKPMENIFNSFTHCNHKVNEKIAEKLFQDIYPFLTKDNDLVTPRVAVQDYYIAWDVIKYFKDYCKKYHLNP